MLADVAKPGKLREVLALPPPHPLVRAAVRLWLGGRGDAPVALRAGS